MSKKPVILETTDQIPMFVVCFLGLHYFGSKCGSKTNLSRHFMLFFYITPLRTFWCTAFVYPRNLESKSRWYWTIMIANPTRLIMTLMKKKDTNITTQHLFPRSLLLSTKKGSCLSLYQTLSVRACLGPSGLPTLQRPKAIAFGEENCRRLKVAEMVQLTVDVSPKNKGVPLWIIHFNWGFPL